MLLRQNKKLLKAVNMCMKHTFRHGAVTNYMPVQSIITQPKFRFSTENDEEPDMNDHNEIFDEVS